MWPVLIPGEIYIADLKGKVTRQITSNNFYDAEATVSPKG